VTGAGAEASYGSGCVSYGSPCASYWSECASYGSGVPDVVEYEGEYEGEGEGTARAGEMTGERSASASELLEAPRGGGGRGVYCGGGVYEATAMGAPAGT
jgi:hypothetical protein